MITLRHCSRIYVSDERSGDERRPGRKTPSKTVVEHAKEELIPFGRLHGLGRLGLCASCSLVLRELPTEITLSSVDVAHDV